MKRILSDTQIALRNADVASAPLIKLTDGTMVIGRDSECGVVLTDLSVSRFHAELVILGTSITVRDLGSRNGTLVANEPVDLAPLAVGQTLQVGTVHFVVELLNGKPGGDEDAIETASIEDVADPDNAAFDKLPLSVAERRVFDLMLPGLTEKEIAGRLRLSRHTVHSHVRKIYEVFAVRSRAELSALFIKQPNGAGETTVKTPQQKTPPPNAGSDSAPADRPVPRQ
jgi:pSer/pThr/pTyr-binding forkhead associated (FHA) protein